MFVYFQLFTHSMGTYTSKFDPSYDISDLHDKVAIVSGANTGIGFYTVLYLAKKGATVYLGARSKSKGQNAIQRLRREGLDDSEIERVKWLDLDLTDPRKAKMAAKWILTQESRLDILVNNAGKLLSPYGHTPDDFSDSMIINHVSPFVFTQTLLPLMEKTSESGADVRIVNLSSRAHRWVENPRYDSFERLNSDFSHTSYPKTSLYAYTKLASILYTRDLQRRLNEKGSDIIVISLHPGSGMVKVFLHLYFGYLVLWFASLWWITPSEGSHPSLFAAASPEVRRRRDHFQGEYIVPGNKVEETSKDGKNMALAAELWDTTELVAKGFGV